MYKCSVEYPTTWLTLTWLTWACGTLIGEKWNMCIIHLCMAPPPTTLSLVQFQHSGKITFLHFKFMCEPPSPHHFIFGLVSIVSCGDLPSLKHPCMGPFYHITLFRGSVSTFRHDDLSALTDWCVGTLHQNYRHIRLIYSHVAML